MIVLGIISILQMIVLPGIIFIKFFNINYVPKMIAIFGFSLFFNYLLVVFLTFCHLFSQITILIIIFIEIATCLWMFRKKLFESYDDLSNRIVLWVKSKNLSFIDNSDTSSFFKLIKSFVIFILLIFAITDIVWIFQRFTNNIGTVFQTWDAIVSWNQWAIEWSKGLIPAATSYYPQLIPANWSISYVLMSGIELQLFPKAIMSLFSLLILIMLFDLGIKTRSFGFFIGVIFTRLLIKKFTGEFIADGYMDLPMAFFSFASVYLLIYARFSDSRKDSRLGFIFSSIIMAASAALTKQSGVYVFVLLPLLSYLLVFRQRTSIIEKNEIKKIILVYCFAFLIVASWYFTKWVQIRIGVDSSNVGYVTKEIYHGAGYLERAVEALNLLGKYKFFLFGLIPAVFLVKPPYRWLGLLLAIPFSIIWIFFFSYETRNLALIFPIWGLLIGLSIQQLFDYGIRFLKYLRIHSFPVITLLIIIILGLGFIGIKYPVQKIQQDQIEKQWKIFNPDLNNQIKELISETGSEIKILTNYPIDYLPGLKGSQVSFWYDNLPDYLTAVKNPEIDYLLVPNNSISDIKTEIQAGLENGSFQLLFTSDGAYSYQMIKVIH